MYCRFDFPHLVCILFLYSSDLIASLARPCHSLSLSAGYRCCILARLEPRMAARNLATGVCQSTARPQGAGWILHLFR